VAELNNSALADCALSAFTRVIPFSILAARP
jgi:hypothetical protein